MIGRALRALRAVVYAGLGVAEAVVQTYDRGKRLVRALVRSERPMRPLTYRDVSHQQHQSRATTERHRVMCPPPR